jgi:hypothetical protein
MLKPIGQMTKTLNSTMYAERDHKQLYNMYCIYNPTCMYFLVNKGQTSVKSINVKKIADGRGFVTKFGCGRSFDMSLEGDFHELYT